MLVVSGPEVERLLDLDALVDALATAMADLSSGRASVPERIAAVVPEREALLAAMPGYVPSTGALMSKLVSLFPGNAAHSIPTHQAVIVVFEPDTGTPAALLDGTSITALRTGAGSALSARLLAREDASTLAILGTGVQARSHARAVSRVRGFAEVLVAGRDPVKARRFAGELSGELEPEVRPLDSFEEAVESADVVCATTHAVEPVVRRPWVRDGTHVTSVGYNPSGRELDDETVADALVAVESRRAVLAPVPAGSRDLVEPIERGVITKDDIHAEIGELVSGAKPGRTSPAQITLYKSVGVAAQDAAAAALVLEAARERGVGREVAL